MALIKVSQKGQSLTCNELDNNFDYVLDLANATGTLDCSKISQSSLSTCLSANAVVIAIQQDISDNATAIGEVSQDLLDAQTTLQGNINALTTLINNQNTTIADLTTQLGTLTAAFNALDSTVSAFNSRLLSVEGRLTTLEDAIASGIIVIFVGLVVDIPTGWQYCDGTNGTPDLRDKFIVGAGPTYAVNSVGGSSTHSHTITGTTGGTALTVNQMPYHNHDVIDPGHSHLQAPLQNVYPAGFSYQNCGSNGVQGEQRAVSNSLTNIGIDYRGANEAHTHTFSATTGATNNLPPYYALAYIMKL